MSKSLSHRIASVSMALLMLLSSTSFSMDIHYCQDKLQGISFFGKAKSCHQKQETPSCHNIKKSCHHQKGETIQSEKDSCCHNETVIIENSELNATDIQITTFQDIQLDFLAAFVAIYIFNYNMQADLQACVCYKPPLPDRDIHVLYQTFLI